MTSSEPRARFPLVLTILTGLSLVLLIALGVWQVQRLQWKTDLIAAAEAAAEAPPAPLAAILADTAPEFRRAIIDCPGLDTARFVELQTIDQGRAGVRLISACRPPDTGVTLLIDRGFVDESISARPPVAPSATPVRIVAMVRMTPPRGALALEPANDRLYNRDTRAMAAALNAPQPIDERTWFAQTSSNPDWQALEPSAPPAAFSNNHLGYAITWFGLALALVGFYVAILRRRRAST